MRAALVLFLLIYAPLLAQKPNVLWVTIEDTSPLFIGCYGNADARTPVIDRLAREGVRFTNAFSTGTVCAPSRCTIITGVRTYELGTGHHRSEFPLPDFVKGFPYYLRQQGYYVTNNNKTDYNIAHQDAFIRETWSERSLKAGWWGRQPGQPFFAVVNFEDSHQSRTMTHPYPWYEEHVLAALAPEDRTGEDDFEMPPFFRDSPTMRKQLARVYNSITLTDKKIGALLERLTADGLMDSTIIFFFGDHGQGIPRAKTNGINLGYRVPFIIWFPPVYRHLSPWGTGAVSDELISFEDLAPTMIGLAGGQVPEHMKGRMLLGTKRSPAPSRLFLSSDRADNGIDMVRSITDGRYLYSRNYMPYMPQMRYIRYMEIADIKKVMREDFAANHLDALQASLFEPRPAEYLFDLRNDTWETRNLIEDPSIKDVLTEMRRALDNNILAARDIMFLPEYEMKRLDKVTPYVFRQKEADYPLEAIYPAASLSGQHGVKIARQQARLLKSENSVVRYWAVTGLRSQPGEVLEPFKADIVRAMSDPYPPVVVTAAAIAYDLWNDPVGERHLAAFARGENLDLALMTINFLLYVRHPEPFTDVVRSVYERKDIPYDLSAASKDFLGKMSLIPNDWDNR